MARTFWTTLALALGLQLTALAGLVLISALGQASVVSATIHRTALPQIAQAAVPSTALR